MENVGLVLFGVLVDFAFGEVAEGVVGVDQVGDAVEDDLVLVLAGSVVESLFA